MNNRDEGTMCRLDYFCSNVTPVDLKLVDVVALVGEVLQRLCTETPFQIHLTTPGHKARTLQYRVIE
jgi:hypothetical protein